MNAEPVRGTEKLRIAADARKGTLAVGRDADGTVHVTWRDRASGSVAFDRVVFPGDVSFRRIKTGKDADRVYELKYVANNNRFFFWMQEPKADADAENARKLVESIDSPPAEGAAGAEAGGAGAGAGAGAGGAGGQDAEMMSMLEAMYGGGGAGGSARRGGPGGAAGGGRGGAVDPARLGQLLANMGIAAQPSPASTPQQPQQGATAPATAPAPATASQTPPQAPGPAASSSSSAPATATATSGGAAPATNAPASTPGAVQQLNFAE